MSLVEQIYAQALMLAGPLDRRQEVLLRVLCQAATNTLQPRLRANLTPEDCRSDFVSAASLLAVAALGESDDLRGAAAFSVGDVTVRKSSGNTAADCLRRQAELLFRPYQRDDFTFLGV